MKRTTALAVLTAVVVLVPLSHVEIASSDDSWLLMVDGRPVDVAGIVSDQYAALTRDCRPVQRLQPQAPAFAAALEAIRHYSPPDSTSAQMLSLLRHEHWLLAQVRFAHLQNAVVLLRDSGQGLTVPDGGVWSGATHPHRADPYIRRYLQARVPDAPHQLLACLVSER